MRGLGGRDGERAPRNRMEGRRLGRGMGREDWGLRVERERKRREEKEGKLRELGYEFEMPGVRGVEDVPFKVKAVEETVGGAEIVEAEEGVKVLTSGDAETKDVTVMETVTKKRPAQGKTEKKVKKVKT